MQNEQLTYAQLEHLLAQLGYHQVSSPPEARVFANPAYDAVSVLPCADPNEPARPHHLITLRKVATEKGIIEPGVFDELLHQALQQSAKALAKAS